MFIELFLNPTLRAGEVGDHTISIKSGARIAVFGDWGTGRKRAWTVLEQIRSFKPDILVHLGDIYYSGTPDECHDNFKEIIDEVFERNKIDVPVFTLAGNHDMYSGGKGYYGLVDALNDGPSRQGASFFCLRSDDDAWQLLAMDTGYHDYNPFNVADALTFLEGDEQDWHVARLREFKGKTILLSHHQLFSAFSVIGATTSSGTRVPYNPKLLETYRAFAKTNDKIVAWLWGHEHNLCIYEPGYLGLARGRCLGHGAVPVLLKDAPYQKLTKIRGLPDIIDGTMLSVDGDTYANGFAIITLSASPEATTADYYQNVDEKAELVWHEILS